MNNTYSLKKKKGFAFNFKRSLPFLLMLLPGVALLFAFNYLPMLGIFISFKNMRFFSDNIFVNFFQSDWVGLDNFKFFFNTPDAFNITRNTVLYNLVFIILGVIIPITCAIALNELLNGRLAKFYQSSMLLPYFLSWVVVSYLLYAFLNPDYGVINRMLHDVFKMETVDWYSNLKVWPFLFCLLNVWKYSGYGTVIYLAAITGISSEYYEAAAIDGATKWQQITKITIPNLRQIICVLTILALGRVFTGDFGLFFQSSMSLGGGLLKPVGDVIDTYVYNSLLQLGDVGMSSAASLYQSVVGCILIVLSNLLVRKIDKESALF
jgi:putative aldouronate transport system permease protein